HPAHAHGAVDELGVRRRSLEKVCGHVQNLVTERAAGLEDRRPGIRRDAAREAADAVRDGGSVAGHDIDVLEADADRVGSDLRERRLIALTLRRRAARHNDTPTRVESQDGALEGTETHALHADGDTDSAVPALFAEARLL